MSTISTTIGHGITLGLPNYGSPLTVAAAGSISNGGDHYVIFGPDFYGPGTVVNFGTLTAYGIASRQDDIGINLRDTASIDNQGTITAYADGIEVGTIAVVTNGGYIYGGAYGVLDVGGHATVTNTGTILFGRVGVALGDGGSVTNSGTIASGTGNENSFVGSDGLAGILVTNAGGTVVNTGTIADTSGAGISLAEGGRVTNSGTGVISGLDPSTVSALHVGVYVYDGQATIVNSATIEGVTGVAFYQGNTSNQTLIDSGTIIGTGGTAIAFSGGNDLLQFQPGGVYIAGLVDGAGGTNTLQFASGASIGTLTGAGAEFTRFADGTVDAGASWLLDGTETFAAGVTLTNSGTLNGSDTLTNSGIILLSAGTSTIGTLAGTGSVTLTAGSTLTTQATVAAAQQIVFHTGSNLLNIDAAAFSGRIGGFVPGDIIALPGITNTNGVHLLPGDTLEITPSAGVPIDLRLEDDFTGDTFHYSVADDETMVTVACFLAGTRIRTEHGEVAVERLAIGDSVITLSGEAHPIKWIGERAYAIPHPAVAPIRIAAGALADNIPVRDLYVSPLHALAIDGMLIPAGELVNGVSIARCLDIVPIRYLHVELDSHDIVLAEGAAAESFVDCDSREMFSNAAEFARLYPTDQRPRWRFCAPRVEVGPGLEQIRRRIERRSRRHTVAPAHGALLGNLEGADTSHIHGWACDPANPGRPVALEILLDDGVLARVEANRFRADLVRAKVGNGHHGFELRLSRPLSPRANHRLRVRRADDRRELPGSPLLLMAVNVSRTR